MNEFPILPFCRTNLENFTFNLIKEIPKNSQILHITVNGYKVKISYEKINNNLICFGKYKNYFCTIEEIEEITNEFHHLMGTKLSEDIRTICGIGVSFLNWHKKTKFCSNCGDILDFSKNENIAKFCNNCKSMYFPTLNPAIIIAVTKNKSLLVTRKAEWKGKRYGLVAGFIEYGENIEESAIREVFEETGIKIKNIKYIASQFWPFPYQLMIGLTADYQDGDIVVDKFELEEAKWIKFSNLTDDLLPPPSSIAYFLMKHIIK